MNQFSFLKLVYGWMKRGYLAGKYGYQMSPRSVLIESLGKLLYLFPLRRNEVEEDVRCLPSLPQGFLLDVGCGDGDWLLSMSKLGWQVEGLDFDEDAVKVATLRGLRVHTGPLEAQNFPDEFFDAITLNHVIEHVPNPVATLVECRRILKKSGQLILYTPNSDSLGHRVFKEYWRGLEPPRHLHIFCPSSMRLLLRLSGFAESYVRTVNSRYILEHSLRLWKGDVDSGFGIKLATKVITHALALLEQSLIVGKNEVGECLAVQIFNK
ncbi:MAG: class I SAM-dependent methyltransferase [Methylomicrobium sp.]